MCHLAGEVADGVLLNWLTPEHARRSADWVRAGAEAAGRRAPKIYAYVRLAHRRRAAGAKLEEEARRYAGIPAYAANFDAHGREAGGDRHRGHVAGRRRRRARAWHGVVDEVVLRAITAHETVEENLALVRAAAAKRA